MRRIFPIQQICVLAICLGIASPWAHARKKQVTTLRWAVGAPGCEFQRGDDGRYRWRITSADVDMTLIVDSQELSKVQRRLDHVVGAYLTVTYTGADKLEFPADLRMEFVRHHKVVVSNLDPTDFSTRLQNEVDTMVYETDRDIKKNPEKQDEKLARAREYEKEVSEFIEFVSSQGLQAATLTPGSPEAHGWAFFSTKNKWIGPLKSKEDFVLRVQTKEKVWEFPFSLPGGEEDLVLRRREQ